jgi:hypothetical protein
MVGLVVCCVLSGAPGAGASEQSSAGALVRRALEAEARGRAAERKTYLERAVAADPSNPQARGLLGLVEDGGRWVRPEEAGRRARDDATMAAALAEYNARRARLANTVADHWALALWCEAHGLKAEATAHFTAVTRLRPEHPAAWRRLGMVRQGGRWLSPERAAAERAEARAQAEADRAWGPRLASWHAWLGDDRRKAEATRALEAVRDPRAVPMIWRTFATDRPRDQGWAVKLLGQIDAPAASRGLALLALFASPAPVRDAATARLAGRDPRESVGLLIDYLRPPVRYQVLRPVEGPGAPGVLEYESSRAFVRRLYDPPEVPLARGPIRYEDITASRIDPPRSGDTLLADATGNPVLRHRTVTPLSQGPGRNGGYYQDELIPVGELAAEERRSVEATEQQLTDDVEALRQRNDAIERTNDRAVQALAVLTGRDLGRDRESWAAWWTDQLGYTYTSPQVQPRPTVVVAAPPTYVPTPVPVTTIRGGFTFPVFRSCFAAGTPVHTRDGLRAIETLRTGDVVLAQETATGALGFEPILSVAHNPPAATYRVELGDTTIVATGIHRFWKAGQGWVMARDLKPGDPIRTLGGVARVVAVERDEVRPVFNLEVGRRGSFFVGRRGLLVHDNTLVAPTPLPFDAVADEPGPDGADAGRD